MSCARGLWSWGPIDEAIQRLQRRPELLNVGGNVGVLRAETPVGWVSLLRLWLPRAWWLLDHIATACITLVLQVTGLPRSPGGERSAES
jgi:hypothetical protein